MSGESIYSWIPAPETKVVKPARHRSKHNPMAPPVGSTFVAHGTTRITGSNLGEEDKPPRNIMRKDAGTFYGTARERRAPTEFIRKGARCKEPTSNSSWPSPRRAAASSADGAGRGGLTLLQPCLASCETVPWGPRTEESAEHAPAKPTTADPVPPSPPVARLASPQFAATKGAQRCARRKAPLPDRRERPTMGLKSDKNFVVANAVENILAGAHAGCICASGLGGVMPVLWIPGWSGSMTTGLLVMLALSSR